MFRKCCQRHGWLPLCMLAVVLLGCDESRPSAANDPVSSPEVAGRDFDASMAGTIKGRVMWEGDIPTAPPFEVIPNPLAGELLQKKQMRANPHLPLIDPKTRGVANAVVFLKGIDPKQAKRWDYPAVRVEQRNGEFHVLQGEMDSHLGFVRRGDIVEMVSRDKFFHSLHAAGAAFFTLTFPDPEEPLKRRLKEKGIVELTSAAGYYWMRAYLFVDEQPYYARTDKEGRFVLSQVPPGRYEVVCWMPNWKRARHERDPESGLAIRVFFARPAERSEEARLKPGETVDLNRVLSLDQFRDAEPR